MSYSQAWLEDPTAIRAVFVEVTRQKYTGVWDNETLFLSTIGYVTTTADVSFDAILASGVTINESMSLDGGISFSFGDIEVLNPNGEVDSWLDSNTYVWVNGTVKVYIGDPSWITTNITDFRSNFKKVFDGLVSDIGVKSRDTISIKVRDKMERLNSPLTEAKLGAYGVWGASAQPNVDTVMPLVFGEVFNIEPMLIDPSTLEYMFNNGPAEQLIEIRDNGVPIYTAASVYTGTGTRPNGATVTNATGKFKLSQPLAGQITASVQGVKNSINLATGATTDVYSNGIATLVALIVTQYGKSYTRLTAADIDLANFLAFAAGSVPVGMYIEGGENVLSVCQELVNSVGAQLYFNRDGLLQILRLGTGFVGDSITTIDDTDILFHSLSISERSDVVAASKIAYCRNWAVQEGLLTGIPDAHKLMYATEWYTSTSVNTDVRTRYKLHDDPQQKETLLIDSGSAATEAVRLRDYFSIPRTIYKFTGKARLLSLQLGQTVTLTHNRFDLYNSGTGRTGQVYSLNPNWLKSTVEVEVII